MGTVVAEIKMVLRGMRARKARTFLTVLGILIGVAGVITIISLGAGAQSLVLGQITKLGSNIVGILPGKSDESGPPAEVFGVQITTLTMDDAKALSDSTRFPSISAVTVMVQGPGTISWKSQTVDTNFHGVNASLPDVQNIDLLYGRFFDEREDNGSANVMVLGYEVWQELFGGVDPVGQLVKIKSVPFEVIGVVDKRGTVAFQNQDDLVFIPARLAQQQILGIHHVHAINVKINSTENVAPTMVEIRQLLKERHNIKTDDEIDFSVRNLADAIKILEGITGALRLFLTLMAGISLLVGGIGIMNIMLVTVAERTREIGLRKAVGATSKKVRNQFLLEASLITLIGGIIGIVVGIVISYVVAFGARKAGYDWAFIISPYAVLLAVGVSVLVGVVFGMYPAFKASRLNPIDALRYE